MPPRYAYWTILVDEQPTAFRSSLQDELMPTFKRLKEKHPSARMVWFQNGKVWNSRLDAQEAMRERGERGRAADKRQGGFREGKRPDVSERPRLDWKPRGEEPKPRREHPKPRGAHPKLRGEQPQPGGRPSKLEWKPRGSSPSRPPARDGFRKPTVAARPNARRDKTWRPGGDHKDPRQKYKDAKKAKWQRFKKNIRSRWDAKQGQGKKRRDEDS